jgi:hypothetical protein
MHAMNGGSGDVKCVHSGLRREQMGCQNSTGKLINLNRYMQFMDRTKNLQAFGRDHGLAQ